MTATTHRLAAPVTRPRRGPRTIERRTILVLLLVVSTVALLWSPRELQAAAHATCTVGEPAGTTCGEALVHLGYP